jgi:hypothetical protein
VVRKPVSLPEHPAPQLIVFNLAEPYWILLDAFPCPAISPSPQHRSLSKKYTGLGNCVVPGHGRRNRWMLHGVATKSQGASFTVDNYQLSAKYRDIRVSLQPPNLLPNPVLLSNIIGVEQCHEFCAGLCKPAVTLLNE